MAATDSYRMAVRTTPLEGGPPEQLTAIVPARALSDLVRIAAAVGGEGLEIVVEENQVLFGTAEVWLGARRIEGQFPEFRRLLPETFEHEVTLPRAEFADVIARVEVLAGRSPLRLAFAAGRADGLGADPGGRRGPRVAALRLPRRAARDRLQPGVPARGRREHPGRDRACSS